MKILFIYKGMGLGGGETLLLRMAKFLHEQGYHIDILLMRKANKSMVAELKKYCANLWIGLRLRNTHKILSQLGSDYYHSIYTFCLISLIYSLNIQKRYFTGANLCVGVYHTLEFCWHTDKNYRLEQFARQIIQEIPQKNIFFMNEGIKKRHEEKLNYSFNESVILPLPIDVERYAEIKRDPTRIKKNKIVSIGRLTAIKTYNMSVIKAIQNLNQQGNAFEYHIYGQGEMRPILEQYIKKHKLQKQVYLHGNIPYKDFPLAIEDAFLFVGVGTAIVEAAACGIPCLQGIENDQIGETYGLFHTLLGYNLGEADPQQPRYKYEKLILSIAELDMEEYKNISVASRIRAENFSAAKIMQEFIFNLQQSKFYREKRSKTELLFLLINSVFWFFCHKLGISPFWDTRYS